MPKAKKAPEASSGAINFEAQLGKISTTIDGGWNVTFQVSQSEAQSILQLSNFRDMSLALAVVPFTD